MIYYILAFILFLAAIVVDAIAEGKNKNYHELTFFLGAFSGMMLLSGLNLDNPTAMDVYQGKTTLEITYKDSVAVDSTVVFKGDIKL